MGMLDGIIGLLSGATAKQPVAQTLPEQPATAPVYSPPAQANATATAQPQQEQGQQLSNNAKMISDIMIPAVVQLASNEEGEQRAKHISASMAVLTEWSAKETSRVYDNLEAQRGAQEGLVNAQQLSQLMQLNQIEQADSRAMEANQLAREQLAPIDAAISEDTADLGEARRLQNSGNPISWIWGKLKEEYNNETIAVAQQQKAGLQQSAQVNFALNTAERALTSKQMAAAGKREIIAASVVKKLQSNEAISAKEIDFISKQLDLSHKEISDVMSGLNYDLSKQQLSIQKAHLALAQAQEVRQKEAWKLNVAQYGDARAAANETYAQLKDLNLADKPGTTFTQILKAYTNPSAADAFTINAITTAMSGAQSADLFNSTGVANLSYEGIRSNPTLAQTAPEMVQLADATDNEMSKWLATPAGMTASTETKATQRNSILNQMANAYASNGQQHLDDDTVIIPTLANLAEHNQQLKVYNQKAFDVLKTLQTTLKTPNDNSSYFENVVDAAEKNGVGLDVMAQQLEATYRTVVAEGYRTGNLPVKASAFTVGLADNYSGGYNALSGTFGKRAGAVNLLSSKDIHNLLRAYAKRRKTAMEMQNVAAARQLQGKQMNDLISNRPNPLPQGVGYGKDFNSVKTEY